MKKLFFVLAIFGFLVSCEGPQEKSSTSSKSKKEAENVDYSKGIGEIKTVQLNNPLDQAMVKKGQAIYEMKCAACHKTTSTRVVGPGFRGVTERRKPEWIMNMTTNVEVMLEEDPAARELLKECLVRMPNQNLSIGDARDVLEWMYQNDAPDTQ